MRASPLIGITTQTLQAIDGIPEGFRSPGDGVLVDVRFDRSRDRGLEFRRAFEVGKALGQADRTRVHRQPIHLADDRLRE